MAKCTIASMFSELPSGGEVDYCRVSEDGMSMELKVKKHSLIFQEQAIAYSPVTSNKLSAETDGPDTPRGGIRLMECARAIREHQRDRFDPDGTISVHMQINLLEQVDPHSCLDHVYVFQATHRNPMQCAYAYFEFDVKDKKKVKIDNISKPSITFDKPTNKDEDGRKCRNDKILAEQEN